MHQFVAFKHVRKSNGETCNKQNDFIYETKNLDEDERGGKVPTPRATDLTRENRQQDLGQKFQRNEGWGRKKPVICRALP
jgi:hypothetical protein